MSILEQLPAILGITTGLWWMVYFIFLRPPSHKGNGDALTLGWELVFNTLFYLAILAAGLLISIMYPTLKAVDWIKRKLG